MNLQSRLGKKMSEFHIVIVGAGQLGSRHLQALALIEVKSRISVVDPSPDALVVAKARYEQIKPGGKVSGVSYYTDLVLVPSDVDLCIIATNANHRLTVLEQLVTDHRVGYILFEKVLFQSVSELMSADLLLRRHQIEAWVNCPRRMFPAYQRLKEILDRQNNLVMDVFGNDWGMACNAIHFIDLWAFLGGSNGYQLDLAGLSNEVLQSKRPGNMEVQGKLCGHDSEGNRFSLGCEVADQTLNMTVRFETEAYVAEINEVEGHGTILDKSNGQSEAMDYKIVYQSGLTHKVASALLQHGQCDLTSFAESKALHTPFLTQLGNFFSRHGDVRDGRCPIT